MKWFSVLIGIIFLIISSAYAQDIKEVDGVYYSVTKPYSGSYKSYYPNGNLKVEMNLIDGLKDGAVKLYFESGELNELRSYKMNVMHGEWVTYNENKVKVAIAHYLDG